MNKAKPGWLGWLQNVPKQALALLQGKAETLAHSLQEAPHSKQLPVRRDALMRVKAEVRRLLAGAPPLPAPSSGELALLARIRAETARRNRNNVTRTSAYLAFYETYPELHWAFLAHLVSRNGGWAMTDLQGELLPRLLTIRQREHLFQFLERANSLIFHDAYPQLLLYRESLQAGRSLSHLLPSLGVTSFMRPVWDEFRRSRDSALLTCALIVNEQHFIEQRVVQKPFFKQHVLDTLAFKTQSLLQLNQVVFPYDAVQTAEQFAENGKRPVRLAGLILEDFGNLRERIQLGQKLYAILYGIQGVMEGVHSFARRRPHTGSRADFWPELFAPVRHSKPEPRYSLKLEGLNLAAGAAPFYSPRLEQAWKDIELEPPEPGDWFRDSSALELLPEFLQAPFSFDMTQESVFGLHKIELAVLASQEMSH